MNRRAGSVAKRAFDIVAAVAGLVVLSPFLLAIAIAVRVKLGSPILFRHLRPGFHEHPFTLIKFRTMRPPAADEVWYLTDEARLGRLGRFLRSTSLDELPELWNVLRGEMSVVGPRPLLMEYLTEYSPEERRRHDVRPGITGWAAVNGRHRVMFRDRLKMDVWYVDHWSFRLDLRIIAMTISQVLRRQDAAATEDLDLGFPLAGMKPPAGEAETHPAAPTDSDRE